MSSEQHDADAYGQELARISHHQHEATDARFTVFPALAAVEIGHEQADDIMATLEAGAVAGAHAWISESSPPHGSEPRFEDGWFAGVRDVASHLLRIADTTAATGRGRAASSAVLLAHLQQPASPTLEETPTDEPVPDPAPALDATDVLVAAERFPWALAAPGERHWPDGEFLDVALSAVRTEERQGYIERLEAFVEKHRARLEELLRAYGPGSRPASHGRYALIGQPETLVILERMETNPSGLRSQWEKKMEDVFLDDLEFAWGPRIRLSREPAAGPGRAIRPCWRIRRGAGGAATDSPSDGAPLRAKHGGNPSGPSMTRPLLRHPDRAAPGARGR
ncbi:hypothetical protein [Streptomyces sp. NPDC056061]|uniref:hypothetical protein n=1 Tax=Streptomyces sp. NPDC056061 TaxID=3345700 RepID=UPI0035D80E47